MDTNNNSAQDAAAEAIRPVKPVDVAAIVPIEPAAAAAPAEPSPEPVISAEPIPAPVVEPTLRIVSDLAGPDVVAPEAPSVRPPVQAAGTDQPAAPSRSGRFALLAVSIALAAGIGAAAGAGGIAALTKAPSRPQQQAAVIQPIGPAPLQRAELTEETKGMKETLGQLRTSIRILSDNLASVRTSLENSGKSPSGPQVAKLTEQVSKLNDSVERLERAQSEPAARLAKVTEVLERLERRTAAMPSADTTGSVPAKAAATVPEAKPAVPVVDGWVLRRVTDGVAILEGRDRVIEVEAGDVIRNVGRVQEIKRQDGRWVVVTTRGIIR